MAAKDTREQRDHALRREAEKSAQERSPGLGEMFETVSLEEARELIHELRVNKIEMELQNKQLSRIQNELDAQRTRYANLFDHAPAGYLRLDENGLILEANLQAARLPGVDRRDISGSMKTA